MQTSALVSDDNAIELPPAREERVEESGKRKRSIGSDVDTVTLLSSRQSTVRSSEHGGSISQEPATRLTHQNYSVGWVCALHVEMAAAKAMLDVVHHNLPKSPADTNTYTLGSIGTLNVVIACLPSDGYGNNNAATVAGNLRRTFPAVRLRFMVGIGGGVPDPHDVRLGDIVVSNRVIQYDLGKTTQQGQFERTAYSQKPPQELLTATAKLRAEHELKPSIVPDILEDVLERYTTMSPYKSPGSSADHLFDAMYDHVSPDADCHLCDRNRLLYRTVRPNSAPKIHYGGIASGNQVMRHGITRDRLAAELDVLCFEMEAAGLMNETPFLVVRGICDYADSHKSKLWQRYAAAVAAAYTKELLSMMDSDVLEQREADQDSPPPIHMSLSDRRDHILKCLSFEQIDTRRATIKSAYSTTCQWLLSHPRYQDWRNPDKVEEHHGLLWIKGKPGAGKSTLMKFALAHANTHQAEHDILISFFFNARGEELEKSTIGMYRSLLDQLLKKAKDLQDVLDGPEICCENQSRVTTWTIEVLRDLLTAAALRLGERRLICFIDALDECDEQQIQDMVICFEELGQTALESGCQLYVCFASRHYPTIDTEQGYELVLENELGHSEDLSKYVKSHLRAGRGQYIEQVRAQVLAKANGVFMWVVLVVGILNTEFRQGRIFAVKKRLDEIPPKLSDLFKEILRKDSTNMQDLLLCLQWILFARRPLERREFYFAMVSGLDPDPAHLTEWDSEQVSLDAMDRFVLNTSKGLAELTRGQNPTVQFIHESIKDFLVKENGLCELWPEVGQDLVGLSHDRLKVCCHNYLKVDRANLMPPSGSLPKARSPDARTLITSVCLRSPFIKYATQQVLYHADQAATATPQDDFLECFDFSTWIHHNNLLDTRHYTETAHTLYILADKSLAQLIRAYRLRHPSTVVRGDRYHYPIFAALARGHRDTTLALLRDDSDCPSEELLAGLKSGRKYTSRQDPDPVRSAVHNGHTGMAQFLMRFTEFGSAMSDKAFEEVLSHQCRVGYTEVLRAMLDCDRARAAGWADLLHSPLRISVMFGHEDLVRTLLAKGARVNSTDDRLPTTLSLAAMYGNSSIVRMLFDAGAEIEARSQSGRTPLSHAAEQRHEDVVKLLLDMKANHDVQDTRGLTPMMWALCHARHRSSLEQFDRPKSFSGLTVQDYQIQLMLLEQQKKRSLMMARQEQHEYKDTSPLPPVQDYQMQLMFLEQQNKKRLMMARQEQQEYKDTSRLSPPPTPPPPTRNPTQVLRLLIARDGDIRAKSHDGRTVLMHAAKWGHTEAVKLLLGHDPGLLHTRCHSGKTALDYAIDGGHDEIVQLLQARGADSTYKGVSDDNLPLNA